MVYNYQGQEIYCNFTATDLSICYGWDQKMNHKTNSCRGVTKLGARCKLKPMLGYSYCRHHYLQRYSIDVCFLCGCLLGENRSDEHVFPKWLLKEYNLFNFTITLQNGTHIPYRKLIIPCCKTCNNNQLSELENLIQTGIRGGYEALIELDELSLFQWLGKIYYGLKYRELFLLNDRKSPQQGKISNPEELEGFSAFHTFLQSIIYQTSFENFKPWSIFIFKIHEYDDYRRNFDFADNYFGMTISIRMKGIGIIACLDDTNQIFQSITDFISPIQKLTLHPLQFLEVQSGIFTHALLIQRTPKFMINVDIETKGKRVYLLPSFNPNPFFKEWDEELYLGGFAFFMSRVGIQREQLINKNGQTKSFITDEDGSLFAVDKDLNLID